MNETRRVVRFIDHQGTVIMGLSSVRLKRNRLMERVRLEQTTAQVVFFDILLSYRNLAV